MEEQSQPKINEVQDLVAYEKLKRLRGDYQNVARLDLAAVILNRCDIKKNGHLLRDDYDSYFQPDAPTGQGYTACNLNEEILIQLGKKYEINTIKYYLCDYDKRKYSLELAVSEDGKEWLTIQKATLNASYWNTITFQPNLVQYIRFLNTGGNSGSKSGQLAIVKVFAYFNDNE